MSVRVIQLAARKAVLGAVSSTAVAHQGNCNNNPLARKHTYLNQLHPSV